VYAITADTARGGFELCPADACTADARTGDARTGDAGTGDAGPGDTRTGGARTGGEAPGPALFALREGFDHPLIGRYLDFARRHGVEIAGFEFIETANGRLVTYDINTTTNYNAEIEAAAPRPALPEVAAFLGRLLAEESAKAGAGSVRN
jgi:hypothetical protein